MNKYVIGKNIALLLTILMLVWVVNLPIFHSGMLYIEQPTIYLANSHIHSWHDFLNVYLQPKLLDPAVPFFRPSGHFLIYQIIMPLLGWHNATGMLLINFAFLALIGFFMIKLYRLLFSGFVMGGYIAFAVYLMQPALFVSRLTVMHFEFAYVLFLVTSWYCFALFCKKNHLLEDATYYSCGIRKIKFHDMHYVLLAMVFFVIAATFKEPAVMLGLVLISYLCIALYDRQPLLKLLSDILRNKALLQIILLILFTTIVLLIYLTLPWPSISHPDRHAIQLIEIWGALKEWVRIVFSLNPSVISESGLYAEGLVLRHMTIPFAVQVVNWILLSSLIATIFLVCKSKTNRKIFFYRKSLLLLSLACIIFLILPLGWAAGLPWHFSLFLLCFSLMLGFGVEYIIRLFLHHTASATVLSVVMASMIALLTVSVNQENLHYIASQTEGFVYALNQHAVMQPPAIQAQLNTKSVVLVEDSLSVGDYGLGNGAYPLFILSNAEYEKLHSLQRYQFIQYQPRYNGTLFRLAYLRPHLQEEIFPFQIQNMKAVASEEIYSWLAQNENIFCLGYDKSGDWSDRTVAFKQKLQTEKKRRQLIVNPYREIATTAMFGKALYTKIFSAVPDVTLCRFQCDQDNRCKGFLYMHAEAVGKFKPRCDFYRSFDVKTAKACSVCEVHIKTNTVA